MISTLSRALARWQSPIDGSSLAVFRMAFGALMLFESVNYGAFLCLDCLYRESQFLFKYRYFEWVAVPPGIGLELMFLVMALLSIGIMLGWYYRFCMVLFTALFCWHFWLDQALYLNHFYMVILVALILCVVPAHHCASLDVRRGAIKARPRECVPAWSRFWLLAQLEIILLYAGLVKLTPDWLNLEPMRLWMTRRSAGLGDDFPGPLMQWMTQDAGIFLASYGVIALHLIGAPLLLWKRTRLWVFIIYCVFHSINAMVFDIGIFPFLTIAATTLFFAPDWPRATLARLGWVSGSVDPSVNTTSEPDSRRDSISIGFTLLATFIAAWLVAQAFVPLRHHWAPGNVAWNEDGHRFSWRMKLRDKRGEIRFVALRDDGKRFEVNPRDHLTRQQVFKMVCNPDLIWQYAQFIEGRYNEGGQHDVQVYADAQCSLNTRAPEAMINRLVDLTSIDRDSPVTDWTWPLTGRLPAPIF